MAFNILTIRTADYDDGSLYPVLGDERNEIEFEPLDGTNVKTLYANAMQVRRVVGSTLNQEASISEIKASVYITDARVAIACTKYDKGGGWRGASLAVPVLNLASKARAASRRRGKMLVGHVRYPWLSSVGFTEKTGFSSTDSLRLFVVERIDGVKRRVCLELDFPKGTDTAALARLISQRAATYRLRHDRELGDEERKKFEVLAAGTSLRGEPKKFVFYEMPTHFFVAAASAYPKPPAAGAVAEEPAATAAADASPADATPVIDAAPVVATPAVATPAVDTPAVDTPVTATASSLAPPAALQAPGVAWGAPPVVEPLPLTTPSLPLVAPLLPLTAPPVASMAPAADAVANPARWLDDPYGRHQQRFWDGSQWTEHVADDGVAGVDRWPR
ncbi:MAG: DUF2510 domain-containing protein [Ilumatobacteraceae bacterium]